MKINIKALEGFTFVALIVVIWFNFITQALLPTVAPLFYKNITYDSILLALKWLPYVMISFYFSWLLHTNILRSLKNDWYLRRLLHPALQVLLVAGLAVINALITSL